MTARVRRTLLGVGLASAVLVFALAGCGSGGSNAAPPRAPIRAGAAAAVASWLSYLAAGDDEAAFAALAPGSQAVPGDLDNYRRGSGRFAAVYERFAELPIDDYDVLAVKDGLAVVVLRLPGSVPSTAAVPVRTVDGTPRVDPLLDVGSYSLRPEDGASAGRRPTVTVTLDDPTTRARVWFDETEGVLGRSDSFRPKRALSSGWHVVTVVMLRGQEVVARTIAVRVDG